jgi:hypothetical protein
LSWTDIDLSFTGSAPLSDKSTLEECRIPGYARILVIKRLGQQNQHTSIPVPEPTPGPASNTFTIFIKTMENRNIVVDVSPNSTVRDLKLVILAKEGIDLDNQRILFGGKELRELTWKLSDYNVQKLASLQMVGRLKGGL